MKIDAEQDAFRGVAIAMKVNSKRILQLIDDSLDTTAGQGGVKGILAKLATRDIKTDGQTIDGVRTIELALKTIEDSAARFSEILASHKNSDEPSA